MRPGSYTLRILSGHIPSYHSIEQTSRAFDLREGEQKVVEFRVNQEWRKVRIVESGVSVELRSCTSTGNDGGGFENGGQGTSVTRSRLLRNGVDVTLDGGLGSSFGEFERNVFGTGSVEAVLDF